MKLSDFSQCDQDLIKAARACGLNAVLVFNNHKGAILEVAAIMTKSMSEHTGLINHPGYTIVDTRNIEGIM